MEYPNLDSFWYFADTTRHHQTAFDVAHTYPHIVFIHADWIKGSHRRYGAESYGRTRQEAGGERLVMRAWVEENIKGTVLYEYIDRQYFRAYPPEPKRDGSRQRGWEQSIDHGYYAFHFQTLAEATLFRLNYADITTLAMNGRHPAYPREDGVLDTTVHWAARAIASGDDPGERAYEQEIEF